MSKRLNVFLWLALLGGLLLAWTGLIHRPSSSLAAGASPALTAGTVTQAITPTLTSPTLYLPLVLQPEGFDPGPGAVFADPFNTDLGWALVFSANATGEVIDGGYRMTSNLARSAYALAPLASADMPKRYAVEATVQRTPQASLLTEVGLLFDWHSASDFHRFIVYPGPITSGVTRNWWVEKWNAAQNQWDVVQSGLDKKNLLVDGQPNQLKVSRDGLTVTFWINGVEVWRGKSASDNFGQVGLLINPHDTSLPNGAVLQASFDNFSVKNLDLLP